MTKGCVAIEIIAKHLDCAIDISMRSIRKVHPQIESHYDIHAVQFGGYREVFAKCCSVRRCCDRFNVRTRNSQSADLFVKAGNACLNTVVFMVKS